MKRSATPFDIRACSATDQPYLFRWPVSRQGYTWRPGGTGHRIQVVRCTPGFGQEVPAKDAFKTDKGESLGLTFTSARVAPELQAHLEQVLRVETDEKKRAEAQESLDNLRNHPEETLDSPPVNFYPSVTQEPSLVPLGEEPPRWIAPLRLPSQIEDQVVICLHHEFASLRDEHIDEDILKFANCYGLLQDGENEEGESLVIWWNEVLQMSVYLALWQLAKSGEDMRRLVQHNPKTGEWKLRFTFMRKEGRCSIGEFSGASLSRKEVSRRTQRMLDYQAYGGSPEGDLGPLFGRVDEELHLSPDKPNSVKYPLDQKVAQKWVVEFVGDKIIEKLSPMKAQLIQPLAPGKFKVIWCPRSLRDALWLMFAWEISGQMTSKECEPCHRFFHQRNKNQDYCSLRCKELARYRTHPERKKSRKKPAGGQK